MTWQTILKAPIYKAPKKEEKKKGPKRVDLGDGDTGEIEYSPAFKNVIESLSNWVTKCKSVSKTDVGTTGQKGATNLFDFIDKHVRAEVKRSGVKNYGKGVYQMVEELVKIVGDEELVDKDELKDIELYVKGLERVKNTTKLNPRNIIFTVPATVGKDGAESWEKVYGHYRTPNYIKHRKATGKQESLPAAEPHWYSSEENDAQPPFWQALFAPEGKIQDIPGINAGLLPLLKSFIKIVDEGNIGSINKWHIKGKVDRQGLEKAPSFIAALDEVLSDQKSYRDPTGNVPFKRLHINFAAVMRALQTKKINVIDKKDSAFIIHYRKKDNLENDKGKPLVEIKSFFVDKISLRLVRTILNNRGEKFLNDVVHGKLKGVFLHDPAREEESRKVLFERERKANKDNLPGWAIQKSAIKGSWHSYLWS